MITLEDWALIRRLAAEGVPKKQMAERLGISRTPVVRALASVAPPKNERSPVVTLFSPFDGRVRALLEEHPEMPATVLAERVGWSGSIIWFRENVRRLRPEHRRPDPADRLVWAAGDAAQSDLWFLPRRIPLENGTTALLPVLASGFASRDGARAPAIAVLKRAGFRYRRHPRHPHECSDGTVGSGQVWRCRCYERHRYVHPANPARHTAGDLGGQVATVEVGNTAPRHPGSRRPGATPPAVELPTG